MYKRQVVVEVMAMMLTINVLGKTRSEKRVVKKFVKRLAMSAMQKLVRS